MLVYKPGRIGTLSTDVSEEDSKVYGEHSAICSNSNCDQKEVGRWIRPEHKVRRSAVEGKKQE